MDVQFEDNQNSYIKSRAILGMPEVPKMANFLIKSKFAKDEQTAYKLLKIIAISCIVIMIGALIYYFNIGKPRGLTQEDKRIIEEMSLSAHEGPTQ